MTRTNTRKAVRTVAGTALIAGLALALAACFTPTGIPLQVVTATPDVDATDVLLDAAVELVLNAEVDEDTVTATSVQLLEGDEDGTPVAAAVTVDSTSLTIDPDALLSFGQKYTVVLEGTLANKRGDMLSGTVSWSFTTRPLTVNVLTGSGLPLLGLDVEMDGIVAGVTNSVGELYVTTPATGSASFSVAPAFFDAPAAQNVTLDGSVYDVEFVADQPHIFVPDFYGSVAAVPKVVRVTDVTDDPQASTSITAVNYLPGPATYDFVGPRAVEVDYQRGAMYIVDADIDDGLHTLIKITNFPPAADGSDAEVVPLSSPEIYGIQQVVIEDSGDLVMLNAELWSPGQYQLVRIPANLDYASASFGPVITAGGSPPYYAYGVVGLPDGAFVVTGGDWGSSFVTRLDSLADTTGSAVGPLVFGDTGAINELAFPHRLILSPESTYLYISDAGYQFGSPDNSRIVRTDKYGAGFVSYGGSGTGTGQFDNPVILGLLPDNKLYIMDVDNSRLVRIDPGALDGGAAGWAESPATYDFQYWYNYS